MEYARTGWEIKNNSTFQLITSTKLTLFVKSLFDERYLTYCGTVPTIASQAPGVGESRSSIERKNASQHRQ
jgi:hypothetical protein